MSTQEGREFTCDICTITLFLPWGEVNDEWTSHPGHVDCPATMSGTTHHCPNCKCKIPEKTKPVRGASIDPQDEEALTRSYIERIQEPLNEMLEENHGMVCVEDGPSLECQDSDCMRLADAILNLKSLQKLTMKRWEMD